MALVINDRVKETTTTTGTGTVTLGGAVSGFETFAAGIGNSNTTYYCIALGSEFEVGLGTLSSDSSQLTRTTVISSSNSDSAVDFSAGSKIVFCTLPASKTTVLDGSNNLTLPAKFIMPDVTSAKILVADGTSYEEVAVSGDIGIASNGAVTIQNDAVEQAMIADDAVGADQLASNAVVNASVASDAAIADTKLATISTANKVDIGALDIDGASDIGAALADADLIIVDDGANGTEKKSQMSRVKTYIADVTLTTAAQTNITSLGTLTTLTVDNIIINGTNIGHTSDTDAIAISSGGVATFSQRSHHTNGITIGDGANIGSESDSDAITIASNGNTTFSQDVTVTGDFTVNGDTTTINTTNKVLTDSLIELANGTSGTPSNDAGMVIERGSANNAFMGFDESADKFIVGTGTFTGASTGNLSITTGTLVANLEGATVTMSGIIKTDDTTNATSTTDGSLQTDGGLSVVLDAVFGDDVKLLSDASVLSFGANSEITLTHVHDTGLLLEDSGGTPTLQFHDANESISSDGSKLILKSNNVTFNMPTADGSDGHFLKTDGSGNLTFAAASASSLACDDLTEGNAAVLISTSSGNITIDATANDSDIIFKGTDGGVDTTFLTLDGSEAGAATFNNKIIATELDISGDIDVDGTTNLDVVDIDGAVDMASTLGVSGVVTANAGVVVDNITIDGTEIDLSSGDLTLDVAGDIVLDAGGGEVIFKDGSTNTGHVSLDSNNLTIKSLVSDKDMIFQGNDGGSGITALTLDMSAAGAATFNNDVTAFSDIRLKENIETIPDALNKVCQMRGVTFDRIDADGERQMGVIAQEVEKIAPEVVREDKSEDKIKSVAYGNMVGLLIESIKELKAEIEELKKKK
tara:strand:+ start:286 stop:2895 length:2610 start_codon:yes stop_codon:yes gene_type:complete